MQAFWCWRKHQTVNDEFYGTEQSGEGKTETIHHT